MNTAAEGEDFVTARIGRGLMTEISAAGHALRADEPIAVGGTATGPNPYDYLVTALGACTAMTLRLYADRKGWPLQGVTVRLRHGKVHAEDCADCETKVGKVDVIERLIELHGPLDAEQHQRLLEIADRCPVHRTLTSEIRIRTRLGG
jgi:putative redox protein